MCKALGIVLMFLSSGVFLFKEVEEKKSKLSNLKEFIKALVILKNELKFSVPELSHLLKLMSDKTSGKISYIFKEMKNKVTSESDVDLFSSFKSVTDGRDIFSKEATDVIADFCSGFGKKTIDIEIENIKRCERDLNAIIKEESDKFIKERKLIYTLGISIGMVIVILVI